MARAWSGPFIASHSGSQPASRAPSGGGRKRSLRCSENSSHHPIDIQTQSDRVYVLKHRGPRKRTGGRSNPEARQKSDSPETADRRLPETDLVGGGNAAHW